MSTRAIYSFLDHDDAPRHVYKHSDGYPTGAYDAIMAALEHAWPLPRYENDEFAAAFVAGNKSHWKNRLFALYAKKKKTKGDRDCIAYYERYSDANHGGQVRLIAQSAPMIPCREAAAEFAKDIEYRYEIRCVDGVLYVKAFSTNFWDEPQDEEIFSGPLLEMKAWAEGYEKLQAA